MTQEELAERVSKAVETISNIERGHTYTGLETLEQIARAVRTPVPYFFEGYQGRSIAKRRAELQQRIMDLCAQLTEGRLSVAAKLIEALRDGAD